MSRMDTLRASLGKMVISSSTLVRETKCVCVCVYVCVRVRACGRARLITAFTVVLPIMRNKRNSSKRMVTCKTEKNGTLMRTAAFQGHFEVLSRDRPTFTILYLHM